MMDEKRRDELLQHLSRGCRTVTGSIAQCQQVLRLARVGTGHCTQRDAPDTAEGGRRVMSRQDSVNVLKGRCIDVSAHAR